MLTKKQRDLLEFIHKRLQRDGVPPSFDEMKDALDLRSKSGIHRLITALEERGFIRRLAHRARAIEIVKFPDDMAPAGFKPTVIEGGKPEPKIPEMPKGLAAQEVPIMGKIAAGVPISAIQDNTHAVTVPPEMIGSGEHFALTVEGDSMIDAGIHDGDTVIIRQGASAIQGDIVVALVDDEEATLKTFRRENGAIALEAANPAYETRRFTSDRVKVQGKLVGLIRQYH